jgi:hypothetical protein
VPSQSPVHGGRPPVPGFRLCCRSGAGAALNQGSDPASIQ